METYKRSQHKFLYNLTLYSLTSMITCLFISYPLWLPSVTQCLYSIPSSIPLVFDTKFLFILVNLIVLILIGESRLTRQDSSSASEMYDEYIERSRISRATSPNNKFVANEKEEASVQGLYIKGNLDHEEKNIKEIRVLPTSVHRYKKKQSVLRASKSEVWRKSGEIMKTKAHYGKLFHEEKEINKIRVSDEEIGKCQGNDIPRDDEVNMRGLKASKSEVWGESEKVENERAKEEKVEEHCMPTEELNTRVEAFIAKVNKQRQLEAKLFRNCRGY